MFPQETPSRSPEVLTVEGVSVYWLATSSIYHPKCSPMDFPNLQVKRVTVPHVTIPGRACSGCGQRLFEKPSTVKHHLPDHLQDQMIRLATGERITADVWPFPMDQDLGVCRHGDHEITLQPHACCFTGDQWIERAIPERLIEWAEKHYSCEVVIMGLAWDEDNNYWGADLLYMGPDDRDGVGGVTFTLDAQRCLHIQQVWPHSLIASL